MIAQDTGHGSGHDGRQRARERADAELSSLVGQMVGQLAVSELQALGDDVGVREQAARPRASR